MRIFADLDGSMFDNTHRMDLLPQPGDVNRTEGWEAFNKACADDQPIWSVVQMITNLFESRNFQVCYVTGRTETCLEETLDCFARWQIPVYGKIHMRPVTDHRNSVTYKRGVFEGLGLGTMIGDMVIEDDPKIIEMVAKEFPTVLILRVPSMCAAVQVGRSTHDSIDNREE